MSLNNLINDQVDVLVLLRDKNTGKPFRIVTLIVTEEIFNKIKPTIDFFKINSDITSITYTIKKEPIVSYSVKLSKEDNEDVLDLFKMYDEKEVTKIFQDLSLNIQEIVDRASMLVPLKMPPIEKSPQNPSIKIEYVQGMWFICVGATRFNLSPLVSKYKLND